MEAAWSNEASSSSSSSSSSISTQFKYEVFLSISGVDTRSNFTNHLLAALEQHGFHTFRDDTKINRGEYIGDELLKAIEGSRISLVVLSENYAEFGKFVSMARPTNSGESDMASRTGSPLLKAIEGSRISLVVFSKNYPGKRSRLWYLEDVHEDFRHGKVRVVVCSEFLNNRPRRNQHQHGEDMVDPNDHFVLGCSVATGSDYFEAVGTGSESTVECQMAGRNFYTLPPSNQVMASIDIDIVTVKAKYQTYTIKFQLSRPWGMAKLEEQVQKRLKELDAGTYLIKYKDEEGEMILIACDEDLQFYIKRSRLQDPTTSIVVFLERK